MARTGSATIVCGTVNDAGGKPTTGEPGANLRRRPQLCITFRAGWQWEAVEGRAELIGPDDVLSAIDANAQRLLLRKVFAAAGGNHDDWDEYDRTMIEQGRTAALVSPSRTYGN